MIKFDNVSFKYNNNLVLDSVNLEIKEGECVLLTGASGSGKTSLLRLINGLNNEYFKGDITGNIYYKDKDLTKLSILERSFFIGCVYQNPKSQFFCTSVVEELSFSLENKGIDKDIIFEKIDESVQRFSIENLMDKNLFNLSSGEKQKIACCSVDISSTPIILLDEPSSNLDLESTKKLASIISLFKKMGKTIIIVEHRINYIYDLVDNLYILNKGKIEKRLSKKDLNILCDSDLEKLKLRSRSFNKINKADVKDLKPIIYLKDYSLFRNKKKLLDKENIYFYENKINAIVSSNGSGKTSLLRDLSGIEKLSKGSIYYNNKKHKNLKKYCYLVSQDVNLQLFSNTVLDEVLLINSDLDKVNNILKTLNLDHLVKRHPMSLSGGEKQRLCLACALVSDKKVILLDEITSGLDYQNMNIIANVLKNDGRTFIIVTHDYEFINKCNAYLIPNYDNFC